jgi:hypothetical protein
MRWPVNCASLAKLSYTSLSYHTLAVKQARVRFSARHHMEVLLLLSEEAMRIQMMSRMVKDKLMYNSTV